MTKFFEGYEMVKGKAVSEGDTIDSGAYGKFFEAEVKKYLRNTRGRAVSTQGKFDTKKFNYSISCKMRCATLAPVDFKADYTVYYIDKFVPAENYVADAIVLPTKKFIDIIKACGLLRLKENKGVTNYAIQTFYYKDKKSGEVRYSKAGRNFADMLYAEGVTLENWITENK